MYFCETLISCKSLAWSSSCFFSKTNSSYWEILSSTSDSKFEILDSNSFIFEFCSSIFFLFLVELKINFSSFNWDCKACFSDFISSAFSSKSLAFSSFSLDCCWIISTVDFSFEGSDNCTLILSIISTSWLLSATKSSWTSNSWIIKISFSFKIISSFILFEIATALDTSWLKRLLVALNFAANFNWIFLMESFSSDSNSNKISSAFWAFILDSSDLSLAMLDTSILCSFKSFNLSFFTFKSWSFCSLKLIISFSLVSFSRLLSWLGSESITNPSLWLSTILSKILSGYWSIFILGLDISFRRFAIITASFSGDWSK